MVASTHWLASASGMAMLERGGNAFDAAAAAAFVLQVVEPHMNGLGGEVPIILWSAERQRVDVICGQGPAPAGATIEHVRRLGLDLVPGSGLLAACVPGAFGAWAHLVRDYGRLDLVTILEPATGYAREGIPVTADLHAVIADAADRFRTAWPTSAATWLPGGSPPPIGSIHGNEVLANTYQRLVDAGTNGMSREARIDAAFDAFYTGFVADAVDRFAATPVIDGSGPHAGVITADDMARFSPMVEAPLQFDYAGVTACKAATWTQGLVFLQQLALLAHTDVGEEPRESGRFAHLVIEAAKLALADREAWYGDPAFVEVPVDELLSPGYSASRAVLIGEEASFELRPGSPGGRLPTLPQHVDSLGVRLGTGDTVHVDAADRWGNVVAATPSGGWLQDSPTVPGLGFCLGTRAQMFTLTEGQPGSLAGRKRPRSTLTPTLVLRDGLPWLAFGTPGGDSQDQWSLVFLLTLLHHEPHLQRAIDAPTFHTLHAPSSFYPRARIPGRVHIEGHAPAEAISELRRRGHDVVVDAPWSQGLLSAVGIDVETGWLRGAANARTGHATWGGQGYAVGR